MDLGKDEEKKDANGYVPISPAISFCCFVIIKTKRKALRTHFFGHLFSAIGYFQTRTNKSCRKQRKYFVTCAVDV